MSVLTGLTAFEWALWCSLCLGAWLAVLSLRDRLTPVAPAGGVALALVTLALYPSAALDLPAKLIARPTAMVLAVAAVAATYAACDWLLSRARPGLERVLKRALSRSSVGAHTTPVASAILVAVVVATALGVVWRLDQASVPPLDFSSPGRDEPSVASARVFDLPGAPMDLVMVSATAGYVSIEDGRILHFELPPTDDAELQLRDVASGMQHLRGIAVRDGELYVVELGPLPCPPEVLLCKGNRIDAPTSAAGELVMLRQTRASIRAFPIAADGSLAEARTVLSDLPVVGGDHAVNGMVLGPDGRLYVSVGNVEIPSRTMDDLIGVTPHPDWLGTILALDESDNASVFARGLRNVYGLAFDPAGALWAIDNDGPARDGWRHEEVLQVKEGRNYGHPYEGTFGPKEVRDDDPVWLMSNVASAGLVASDDAGLGPGLLVGWCGSITHLRPAVPVEPWARGLRRGSEVELLADLSGCVTGIAGLGDGRFLATLFRWGGSGQLILAQADPPSS